MVDPFSTIGLKENNVFTITLKDPKGFKRYGHMALCVGDYCHELTSRSKTMLTYNKNDYFEDCNRRLTEGKTPQIILHQLKASLSEMEKLLYGVASTLQHNKQWSLVNQFVCSTFCINLLHYATQDSGQSIKRHAQFHIASWFCSTPAKAVKLIEASGRVIEKSVYTAEQLIPLKPN